MYRPITTTAVAAASLICATLISNAAEPSTQRTVKAFGITYQFKSLPAPFKLTGKEQADVTKVLEEWERNSANFKNYACTFDCFEYSNWAADPEIATGSFRIDEHGWFECSCDAVHSRNKPADPDSKEAWQYDGTTWTHISWQTKEVTRTKVPQQPKANVRVPFVLRANAKELDQQFYIRVKELDKLQNTILLQFYPRTTVQAGFFDRILLLTSRTWSDWRSYDHVDLILLSESFIPQAMQLHHGADSRTVFVAREPTINTEMIGCPFDTTLPQGWKEITLPTNDSGEKSQSN